MDTVTLIQQLGFPAAMIVLASLALWRAGKWFGVNVLLPLVQRHILFIDNVEKSLSSITNTQERMAAAMDRVNCQAPASKAKPSL